MGNTRLELGHRMDVYEDALESALARIVELEEAVLEPLDAKLTEVAQGRFPDGEAVAVFGGVHKRWNAYIPLADEPMTQEMANDLARDYNERRLKAEAVPDSSQSAASNGLSG